LLCRDCEQIQRDTGLWYSAEYSTFSISDEVGKYQLTVAGYSGDAGDAMAAAQNPVYYANGRMFSTQDSDNDANAGGNCAADWGGGWWFRWCSTNHINRHDDGIWVTGTPVLDVQASRMLVKLN